MENSITELLNLEKLQQLTEEFHAVTGLSTSVVDTEGTILAGSGWQEICSRFHRVHERTANKCLKSAAAMKKRFAEANNGCVLNKCPNGLYDAAAPVIVDGQHVASLFTGQFLMFRPDISDIENFSTRARQAGFNETDYLNALEKVPTLSPARLDDILLFLKNIAGMLSDMGMSQKKGNLGSPDGALNLKSVKKPVIISKVVKNNQTAVKKAGQQKKSVDTKRTATRLKADSITLDFNDILSTIIGYSKILKDNNESCFCLKPGYSQIDFSGRSSKLFCQMIK